MKGKYLTFFLVVGLSSFVINAQKQTDYKDVPEEKSQSETVTSPSSNNPSEKTLDKTTQERSKTKNASIAVRVIMGILGVVCYELKECRESLNVQPTSPSQRESTTQIPYTFLPRFNANSGKYSFVTPNSANTSNSSNVNAKNPSFYYQLAPDWSVTPSPKAGKVTIYPRSQGGGLALKTAIILGVTPIQSGSIYTESQNYVERMVESNQYLSNSNGFKSETIGNKQCYYKQLFGFSKDVNANETVTFFGCKLNENTMFYSVLVYNDKTTESDKQSFWQIWNSVELPK